MNLAEHIRRLVKEGFSGEIMEGVPLRDYTSLRIGGPCDIMVSPKDPYSLKLLLEFLKRNSIDYFVLGGGTNIVVSDEGFRGVVITLRHWQRIEPVQSEVDEVTIFVLSGTSVGMLLSYARDRGLSGLEGLVGIPGTVGGAVVGNAGAFGYEFLDVVDRITIISETAMDVIKKDDISYGYRQTSINSPVIAVHLKLRKADPEDIKTKMKEFLAEKKRTQPLDMLSAGCVFKNPQQAPAGKLIDEAGLKGYRIGDIQVSEKHANFFVNLGKGTAEQFVRLMETVIERVHQRFSITLEPEVKLLGFEYAGNR